MPGEVNDKGWILHSHGQGRRFGPLTEDELRNYFRAGMVKSVDRLTAPGEFAMQAAADVAEKLGEAVPPGPPPPEVQEAPAPPPPMAIGVIPDAAGNEDRAARAAAAMNIDIAALMAANAPPAKQRSPLFIPLVAVVTLVVVMLVGLSMLRKMKPGGQRAAQSQDDIPTEYIGEPPPLRQDRPQISGARAIPEAAPAAAAAAPAATATPADDIGREYLPKAQALENAGDWAALVAHADLWLRAQPGQIQALNYLGTGFAGLGNHVQAEQAFKQVLAREPRNSIARSRLAEVYQRAQRFDEAASLYKQMVAESPDDAIAWNNYGAALSGTGQPTQAIAALQNAVRLDPKFKEAWTNLGNVYQATGDTAKASAAFANAK